MQLKDLTIKDLGSAKKVVVEKDHTTIIDGSGSKKAFKERIAEIQNLIERSTSEYDKKNQKERLAKLTNGVAALPADRRGFVLCAVLLGWGGLSVHAQTLSVLEDTGLSARRYLLGKTLQAALSAPLALLAARWVF